MEASPSNYQYTINESDQTLYIPAPAIKMDPNEGWANPQVCQQYLGQAFIDQDPTPDPNQPPILENGADNFPNMLENMFNNFDLDNNPILDLFPPEPDNGTLPCTVTSYSDYNVQESPGQHPGKDQRDMSTMVGQVLDGLYQEQTGYGNIQNIPSTSTQNINLDTSYVNYGYADNYNGYYDNMYTNSSYTVKNEPGTSRRNYANRTPYQKLSPEKEQKIQEKKNKNKIAANKCRQKKQKQAAETEMLSIYLVNESKVLHKEQEDLLNEWHYLMNELKNHNCLLPAQYQPQLQPPPNHNHQS